MTAIEFIKTGFYDLANLAAYFRFEGNSTESKFGNNGTDTDITYSTANGKFEQGAGFDGDSSNIVLPNVAILKPTGNFTVGMWAKPTTTANYKCLFQVYGNGGGGYKVYKSDGDFLEFNVSGATGLKSIEGTVDIGDGDWHFLVCTWDGTKIRNYVDGAADGNANGENATYDAAPLLRIGCANDESEDKEFYQGAIDDLFIFNGTALSSTQITALYDGTSYRSNGFASFL